MTMDEFDAVSHVIHEKAHEDGNIIVGLVIDESLGEEIKVTAIATGFGDRFDQEKAVRPEINIIPAMPDCDDVDREIPTFIRERRENGKKGYVSHE